MKINKNILKIVTKYLQRTTFNAICEENNPSLKYDYETVVPG